MTITQIVGDKSTAITVFSLIDSFFSGKFDVDNSVFEEGDKKWEIKDDEFLELFLASFDEIDHLDKT